MSGKSDQNRPLLLVVAAALVDGEGRVLLAQRPAGKALAGLWEFPGGKVEPGESPEAALARELREELDVQIDAAAAEPIGFASHAYDAFHLMMPLFLITAWLGNVRALEAAALAWVRPRDLGQRPMPPADLPLISQLQRRLGA